MNEWICYEPVFACDRYQPCLLPYGPFAGLRDFVYDLVRWQRPKKLVELGCHYGCSSFAFLQAVRDGNLDTGYWGIDTWRGDLFTRNDYRDDVYGEFCRVLSLCYDHMDTHLLRCSFQEAAPGFADESIDLLHIDGSHMYEDVRRDFDMWLPKMKKDGVILLHDVADYLFYEGEHLGSWRFFSELCCRFPHVRRLPVSCGLGLVFLSEEMCRSFDEQAPLEIYIKEESRRYEDAKARLREMSFRMRDLEEVLRMRSGTGNG